jgi:GTP cyclohydrolase I
MDKKKIEEAIKLLLEGMGEDLQREDLVKTPERVARLYSNLFVGYGPEPTITKFHNTKEIEEITVRQCDFISFCPHHILPYSGTISIAYVPDKWLIGLDKVDLIVDYAAGRLDLQENLVARVADMVMNACEPYGVFVQAFATHFCALCKGNQGGGFATTAARGVFVYDSEKVEMIAAVRREAIEIFNHMRE